MSEDRGRRLGPTDLERHRRCIDDLGWTILPEVIDPDEVERIRSVVRQLEVDLDIPVTGIGVEGHTTRRMYNLLAKHPIFESLPIHPVVLSVVEHVLDPECLLSGMTTIDVGPGEKAQTLHGDDMSIAPFLKRPHPPWVLTAIWSLTDFTASNGGTRLVPGSHRWQETPRSAKNLAEVETVALEMTAGSVMVFHGSLWHGSGANTTPDEWRLGLWVQYCHGFLRQQQNSYVGVPPELAATFAPRLRELLGLELYRGVMGHVDGVSPSEALTNRSRSFPRTAAGT